MNDSSAPTTTQQETLDKSAYREMSLLDAVTQSPDLSQRALAKRIGVAVGLTNLLLRRLATKGYIKIINVHKSRLRYLITPQGMLEKARLTREYVEYSLFLYRNVRTFLRERLSQTAKQGQRRILLCGVGELAEIAYLTMQEVGLLLVGVVDEQPAREHFLGYRVFQLQAAAETSYDCLLITSLRKQPELVKRLLDLGVSSDKLIILPQPGMPELSPTAMQPSPALVTTQTQAYAEAP